MVDGSWTAEAQYNGYGWVWMDESGIEQLLGMGNKYNLMASLHS